VAVERVGPTPPLFEYVLKKALVPHHQKPATQLTQAGSIGWVEIPRYQRGISWTLENVEEFLDSESVILGNVILGNFTREKSQFPNLPHSISKYLVLVDGLQRFAVGTMLLAILHPMVFASMPTHPNLVEKFSRLFDQLPKNAPIVYQHNDVELQNHPRKAIASQYKALRESVKAFVQEKMSEEPEWLAEAINRAFLDRQIAIDEYYNFSNPLEIMSTFLGINTIRVDLGPVDLVRAYIIERGTSSGWSVDDINDIENTFTEVFTDNEKPYSELLPFASIILKMIQKGTASRIFPSWEELNRDDVERFFDFVNAFRSANGIGYFKEIRECGSLPFTIVLAYYYVRNIHQGEEEPSFLSGGRTEDPDLHRVLVACYRSLLAGTIGRTRHFAEDIMSGDLDCSLAEIADKLSQEAVGKRTNEELELEWLLAMLNRVDSSKAKRVFNAMLLPPRASGFGTKTFQPLVFGRGASMFHVDHLIPQHFLVDTRPGAEEGKSIRNLAPLPSSLNRKAKAVPCSEKLKPKGMYDTYLRGKSHPRHPYCKWLVGSYARYSNKAQLDKQEHLEPNKSPAIGTHRVQHIAKWLRSRL